MAPLFYGSDDGGEIIVCQHHVRGLLGHLGAADTHGDADIRCFQGGRVIDAIAGHGHHQPPRLQGLGNRFFVFRSDPGKHRYVGNGLLHLRLSQVRELCSSHHLLCGYAQLFCHRLCRVRVVAGDHHGANSGALALRHGAYRRLLGRVNHALQANKTHLGQILVAQVILPRREFAHREAQGAQGVPSEQFCCV